MNDEAIVQFGQSLRGALIGRNHPEYGEARKLYNAMIDKRPLLIARCGDVADVITAVNFGRDNKLPIAIRGGGHNGPGLGSVNDGLVIDLSTMRGVRVDPKNRTVRVGAGCTTGDVDHATQTFGRAVPFGVLSTTGVAGLTLSGTGREISSRLCRTKRSKRIWRTPQSCRPGFPECTSIRSTALSNGRSATQPHGVTATWPGRW
jgi:hypothetical protein